MSLTAFIGVGKMGGPMAQNLARKPHETKVFDLVPQAMQACAEAGAVPSQTAIECVKGAGSVITMVPTGKEVREAYCEPGGIFDNAEPGTLLIDCSTIDVETSRAVAEEAKTRGFRMLDAPVSGGVMGAEAGTLTLMVGGDEADLADARPLLEAMGKNIVYCGANGNGQAAKICNNMIAGITMIAVSEAFSLGRKLGLDPKVLYDVTSTSSGGSWVISHNLPVPGLVATSAANNDFEPGFSTSLMLKDMRLSQQAAVQVGQPTPVGAQCAMLYAMSEQEGLGPKDFSAIVKIIAGMRGN